MLFFSLFTFTTKNEASAPKITNPVDFSVEKQIEYFSSLYQGDATLTTRVMECESSGRHSAVGDGGRSRGIFQFQKATFISLSKLMGETLDFNSRFDQIKLATWAIANGHGDNWTAYRAIKRGGKYSFYSSQLKQHFTVYCKL